MKNTPLLAATIGTAMLITAPVFAQDATEAPSESSPPPATIDTDGDGVMDAWDQRGDGQPDAFDQDGDGAPDPKPETESTPDPS